MAKTQPRVVLNFHGKNTALNCVKKIYKNMTNLKNFHSIDILKKKQKRSLFLYWSSECNKTFWRSFSFFSKNQKVKEQLMLPYCGRIKNNERESKSFFSTKVKCISLLPLFYIIQKKYGHRVRLKVKEKKWLVPPFSFFLLSLQKREKLQINKFLASISLEEKKRLQINLNKYLASISLQERKRHQINPFLALKKLFFRLKEKESAQLFTAGKKRLVTSKPLLLAKKAEYKKYNKKIRFPKQKTPIKIPRGAKIGKITIKGTYNNIILTLTDKEGNTKAWASAGTAGFKNGRKSSHYASESAADRLAARSIALGYTFARVKMKGLGGGKLKAIRRLCKSNLQLLGVSDNFSIAYNGCRRARKPRK